MPRVEFKAENKVESPYDYPRLVLDKGERARIVVIEQDPYMEWVHTLRAPQIVDGEVVTETVTRYDKQVEVWKYDFITRAICLGDYSVLDDKGIDPQNCPVCKLASETDYTKEPERRFAMHVVRYSLKAGTFEVAEPFGVQLVAWVFGNKQFNTITDFAAEWGNLREHDILLGPCENKQYQKFDIKVGNKAEWITSDERKQLTAQTYKENQAPDLGKLIGRTLSVESLKDHLDTIITRSKIASGTQASASATATDEFLSGGTVEAPVAAPAEAVVEATTTDEATEEAAPASESGSVNFDDLLNELESAG